MTLYQKYDLPLRKMVWRSTPIMALMIVLPVFLFLQTLPTEKIEVLNPTFLRVGVVVIGIIAEILLIWQTNILLFQKFQPSSSWKGLRSTLLRPVVSFLLLGLGLIPLKLLADAFRPVDIGEFSWYPVVGLLAVNSMVLLLIDLINYRSKSDELQLQKAELEISNLIAQQEQLKQQIHPHFLFNALGTLRALIKKDSAQADYYTGTLATYLRSSLSLAQNDVISIRSELAFLENYFVLQKIRFGNGIQLETNIPDTIQDHGKLPVFALQLLAENAIKHNAFSEKKPLLISITYLEDAYLIISNNKIPKFQSPITSGIGLTNLKLRFQHFTEVKPKIENNANEFSVRLKILGL